MENALLIADNVYQIINVLYVNQVIKIMLGQKKMILTQFYVINIHQERAIISLHNMEKIFILLVLKIVLNVMQILKMNA